MALDASVLLGPLPSSDAQALLSRDPTEFNKAQDSKARIAGATNGTPAPTPPPTPPPSTNDNTARDRAKLDALEITARPPVLTKPPPQDVATDPLQAFGQPAMWLAVFGSLLTRQPMATAIIAAGKVMEATHNLDTAQAKQAYDSWKVESDNALKLAKFEQDAYKAAIDLYGKDAQAGLAQMRTLNLAYQNQNMQHILDVEGPDGLERFLKQRGQTITTAAEQQSLLDKHLQEAKDDADIRTQIRTEHPDWSAGQIAQEAANRKRGAGEGSTRPETGAAATQADVAKVAKAEIDSQNATRRLDGQPLLTDAEEAHIRLDTQRQTASDFAEAKRKKADQTAMLTPDAVDLDAKQYLRTGSMPAMGLGNAAARIQIQNRAAEIAKADGNTIDDYISGRATLKADSASLSQITKIADAVNGFEQTALRNMQIAKELMDKGAGTSAGPVVNRWIQAGRVGTGDADVAAFNTAMGTVAGEYGKIISGGSASIAATPEGARQEAADWLNKIQSPEAIDAQFDVARRDMANRKNSLNDQRALIQQRLRDPSAGGQGTPPAPATGTPATATPATATPATATPQQHISEVSSEAHYNDLASGSWYRKPDDPPGSHRVKP
jgi:hypothetical protein